MNSSGWIQLTERDSDPFFYFRRISLFEYNGDEQSQEQTVEATIDNKDNTRTVSNSNDRVLSPVFADVTRRSRMDLSRMLVASCGQCGLIAIAEQRSGLLHMLDNTDDTALDVQMVYIATASGQRIAEIEWHRNRGSIVHMGWTMDMQLIVLSEHGELSLFNCKGEQQLSHEIESFRRNYEHVAHCRIVHDIVAVYTTRGRLLVAESLGSRLNQGHAVDESQSELDADDDSVEENAIFVEYDTSALMNQFDVQLENINCMEIMPPWMSPSGQVEVLLCPDDERLGGVVVVSQTGVESQELNDGPFSGIQLGPDGKTVALYFGDGNSSDGHYNDDDDDDDDHIDEAGLAVYSPDFNECYLRFETKEATVPPKQIVYCGNECILLYWPAGTIVNGDVSSLIVMVDCYGEHKALHFDNGLHLHQDVDSVLLYSAEGCELLERVHKSIVSVFRIGSLEPGALLYDAFQEYEQRSPAAIAAIHDIQMGKLQDNTNMSDFDSVSVSSMSKDALHEAVEQCVEAACREFDPVVQQRLLHAAVFGRTFFERSHHQHMHSSDANDFHRRCQAIRVLNELRRPQNGISLTYDQFLFLGESVLVARLAALQQFSLAHKMAKYLQLSPDQVILQWTSALMSGGQSDEKIFDAIHRTLQHFGPQSVSLAQIVLAAHRARRKQLAIRLLESDKNIFEHIPLYLSMQETRLAIDRAIESNDTDLLYIVILYMQKHLDRQYMYELLQEKPKAARLFETLCTMENNLDKLNEFHSATGNHYREATTTLRLAYGRHLGDSERHNILLWSSAKMFDTAGKRHKMDATLTENQALLLRLQHKLEQITKRDGLFVGSSIHDTILKCVLLRMEERAEKLKERFQVSERRMWSIRVEAYGRRRDWAALRKLANSRRQSPIGYEPFVQACLREEMPDEAAKDEALRYIPRVRDLRQQVDFYIELGMFKEAIESAVAKRDTGILRYIRTRSRNEKTIQTIDNLIGQLS